MSKNKYIISAKDLGRWVEHMEGLLKNNHPCEHCPCIYGDHIFLDTCKICKTFVGADINRRSRTKNCPCDQLGESEAIKAAVLAIEEYHGRS